VSRLEHFWQGHDYNAIRISTARCNVQIEGTSDDRIIFESDLDKKTNRDLKVNSGSRWLAIDLAHFHNCSRLKMKLPVNKSWIIHLSASRGDIEIKNVQTRCLAILGRGKVQFDSCSGKIAVMAGKADIEIKNYNEVEVSTAAPLPAVFERSEFMNEDQDQTEDQDFWENWGKELGVRIKDWAINSQQLFNSAIESEQTLGLSLKLIRGDIKLDNCFFRSCEISGHKGDLKIEKGQAGLLQAVINKGKIEVAAAMNGADWNLKNHVGDISLKLDPRTAARMDMATRFGSIRSEIPLVRVARQGPCGFHSARMVGLLGAEGGDKTAVLKLVTVHGNIEIKAQHFDQTSLNNNTGSANALPTGEIVDQEVSANFKTPLEVLQALSEKRISVEQADLLLRDYSSQINK
jgi:hypothetical protein